MAFELFKKRKEVVDFRKKDSDMPVPAKIKERLMAGKTSSGMIVTSANPSESSTTQSSGGFFGFFGGSDSSSSNASSPEVKTEAKTDFWGNSVSTSTNEGSSSNYNSNSDTRLNDVLYKLTRVTDRLELVEKKIDRIERKLGIGYENN
jgi:hypothetical protein